MKCTGLNKSLAGIKRHAGSNRCIKFIRITVAMVIYELKIEYSCWVSQGILISEFCLKFEHHSSEANYHWDLSVSNNSQICIWVIASWWKMDKCSTKISNDKNTTTNMYEYVYWFISKTHNAPIPVFNSKQDDASELNLIDVSLAKLRKCKTKLCNKYIYKSAILLKIVSIEHTLYLRLLFILPSWVNIHRKLHGLFFNKN